MNTMKKRLLSCVIAAASVASMSLSAFAAETNMETKITGTYSAPEIAVTVPTSGTAVINPYGLGTEVGTKADPSVKKTVTGQIATAPLFITNESSLNLSVGASVTGVVTARGDESTPLKFATTTTKGVGSDPEAEGYVAPATAKSVYVVLQVAETTAAAADSDHDNVFDAVLTEYVKDDAWTEAAKKQIVVGTKEAKASDLATLKTATLDSSDGSVTAYKAGSIIMYRLTGDCTESPKIAWDDKDAFEVNIAFTFKPASASTGA